MNLYEELKKTAKYFEELERTYARDGSKYNDNTARGKSAALNTAASEIYSLLWQYEEENNNG